MKVFISGASGLLGGNCMQYFKQKGLDVIGSHFSFPTPATVPFNTLELAAADNFDVVNYQPDIIIHCGALTHVDYCETNEEESYTKTVQSTINLMQLAKKMNATFVFISTDYVFDGTNGPYKETDATNPLSVYGKHKLAAEKLVEQSGLNYLILRVTNVYGDEIRNKNFVARIIEQCQQQQHLHLKLPYDQFASPTNAKDIARAMLELLQADKSGIYHICSSDYMNRVELAMKVISYFPNASYDLIPVDTPSLQQPAARPLLGGFVKNKFVHEFPTFTFTSVDNYLQSKI
jgi:dTDP-4-dehydrorhamnose reductase